MFTILYPEIVDEVLSMPGGIHGFQMKDEPVPFFIVKMLHQYLLTAKMNSGFKVYVIPLKVSGMATVGLMTAFFDDPDNPLTIWTALADDRASKEIVAALLSGNLRVYLFDEHNREFLGYAASVEVPVKTRELLGGSGFYVLSHQIIHELTNDAATWFGIRSNLDDADAISINFDEPLYPDAVDVIDARRVNYAFHGAKGFGHTTLIKTEPGQFQEIDIILSLQRIFSPSQIYHAPKRVYDKEEIADIIVITDEVCIIIQAKDSPNTEKMLRNSLDRKRLKAIKQIKEGVSQASGAIGYLDKIQPLKMIIDDEEITIDLAKRSILSLVIVRELFNDSFEEYSKSLFELFDKINLPCVALDYAELNRYTSYCEDANEFVNAYFEVFNFALDNGIFPRLRFGKNDLFKRDGAFKFGTV
ncbi:hypothetical protein [Janthinobacterium sp. JC611]|uniref:hypothetical protein n=1 Tax=Janthinobacterium sp. JC611 TaxID=2816201 RepID=UPI001BFCFEF2|nr:hypothetical protein [Janthinobacterium sp. JC611]